MSLAATKAAIENNAMWNACEENGETWLLFTIVYRLAPLLLLTLSGLLMSFECFRFSIYTIIVYTAVTKYPLIEIQTVFVTLNVCSRSFKVIQNHDVKEERI